VAEKVNLRISVRTKKTIRSPLLKKAGPEKNHKKSETKSPGGVKRFDERKRNEGELWSGRETKIHKYGNRRLTREPIPRKMMGRGH